MSVRHQPGRHGDGLRSERGSAAMLAAVGMALLLVITLSFVSLAQLEMKIGVNRVQEVRATQAAEAGARRLFREMANSWSTASYWLSQPRPYYSGETLTPRGRDTTYTVSVLDNSANPNGPDTDHLVVIQSTGMSAGASRTVLLLVQPSEFAPLDGVRIANHLKVS